MWDKRKKNEDQTYLIKETLNKLKKKLKILLINFKIFLINDKFAIKENEKITNIVDNILYFNQPEQQGSGLKILTPNQMLSRLPITVAQLKAGNNSEKLKNQIRQLLYSLYRSKKNLQNSYIKVWLTLFKNGNNLYEN